MNNIENIKIKYEREYGFVTGISKVYYVDSLHNRFLIVNPNGYFEWVKIEDCEICEE